MEDERAHANSLTAFNCPHCGALAKQFWWLPYAEANAKDSTPNLVARDMSNIDLSVFAESDKLPELKAWAEKMATGVAHLNGDKEEGRWGLRQLNNVNISRCYNCDEAALWLYDRLIWPVRGNAPAPNADLPADIRADYEEAAAIADLSPRGAAALLRLAVQRLCIQLGGSGKSINDDIAMLVQGGLDTRVQQALDVVRVVGNNAVHPGQIDLKDDRATAGKLFTLINLIAERMISQPKHVGAMFDSLPAAAKDAIERRDKKKPAQ